MLEAKAHTNLYRKGEDNVMVLLKASNAGALLAFCV